MEQAFVRELYLSSTVLCASHGALLTTLSARRPSLSSFFLFAGDVLCHCGVSLLTDSKIELQLEIGMRVNRLSRMSGALPSRIRVRGH